MAGASTLAPDQHGGDVGPILEFCGLAKAFGGTLAVDDIRLDVRHGEILALLGQNGAGKSTLIKILAGVHPADSGHMLLRGQPYDPRVDTASIAFIHQDLGLIDWMTVAENIAFSQGFPRKLGLIDWGEVRSIARRSLALVADGIDPEQRVQDLTRTEKSLVAIARALGRRADVLVLDEPTASLPQDEVDILFDVLRSLKARGVAMIYVSHRLDEVYAISDRLAVLRDGRLVAVRDTGSTQPDELVRLIIGRPPRPCSCAPSGRRARPCCASEKPASATSARSTSRCRPARLLGLSASEGPGTRRSAVACSGCCRSTTAACICMTRRWCCPHRPVPSGAASASSPAIAPPTPSPTG